MTDTLGADTVELGAQEVAEIFDSWLGAFAQALGGASASGLTSLLTEDATWRDFMAFPWDFHNVVGRDETVARLAEHAGHWDPADFAPSSEQPPVVNEGSIQAFFDFTTTHRVNRGFVLLVRSEGEWLAKTLQTQAVSLQEFPERIGRNRPEGKVYGLVPGRTRYRDDREKALTFEDREPSVVVLGAGHNGLATAARLEALGVSTLVIDREERVGDTWRKRYAALALHSSVYGDHLPYVPLPPTWTAHTPKDKFADLLESYATLMELNLWMGTEFLDAHYDEDERRWAVQIQRADGSTRTLRPRHFVVAGGMFAAPKMPEVKGLDTFPGIAMHSDSFQDGADYAGKRALVVGAGVSAHELAHDLWEHGAEVTMLQRSATYVITYDSYHRFGNPLFAEEMTYTPDFADQVTNSVPYALTPEINKARVKAAAEYDRELLGKLEARGFKLEWGPDGTGIIGAHQSGRDSYQIDIGASQLVAEGHVGLKQGVEISEVRGSTVVFSDGSTADFDVIVFATGYHQFWGHIKPLLGQAADRVDQAYGIADDGEYANTWRRSAQPGLWFGSGFIRMARFYTKFTALLIKAIEEDLIPYDPEQPRD